MNNFYLFPLDACTGGSLQNVLCHLVDFCWQIQGTSFGAGNMENKRIPLISPLHFLTLIPLYDFPTL